MRLLKGHNMAGFVAGTAVCVTVCLAGVTDDTGQAGNQRRVIPSATVSPEVPSAISFCGKEIDLTRYNRHEDLDRELSGFTYLHSTTMLLIKRANRYFPEIEPILETNGIPDDFKYLAVIESNLNPCAVSPARAVGMWQLLEGTARECGLTVTPTVDERCDVTKATVAACRYLKKAYEKYGDWATVAAAYNSGMGRISGELARQNADSSLDLWLVEETTRYVYRILAVKEIFEHPYKYGFMMRAKDLYKPIVCENVTVSADIADLTAFAREKGLTYADLKRFNPWLRTRTLQTAGKSYTLRIPKKADMYYKTPNTYVHNPAWVIE